MDTSAFVKLSYLVAAALFILGLKNMAHPRTAVRGNMLGAAGMFLAVIVTLMTVDQFGFIAVAALVGAVSNIAVDRSMGNDETGDAIGYPGFAGFELEDGIYLLAPITWLGFLEPFFFAATIGAAVYGFWTLLQWYRLKP